MKLGSVFSGGGLGDFGFMAAGMEICWQVEIDDYCQKILELRYPESKKYRDIKTIKGQELDKVDIITGGFPCQPFSVAGKQKGKEDNRYLWPEMLRVIKECRPRWIVGENVPGIINLALDTVCSDLEAEGYEVWPVVFPSHALGALHKRDRLWIICHTKYDGQPASQKSRSVETRSGSGEAEQKQASESSGSGEQYEKLANSISKRLERWKKTIQSKKGRNSHTRYSGESIGRIWRNFWAVEPSIRRVVNGCTHRVERLKMLGNGQVPACTYVIGKMIMEIEATAMSEQWG